MKLSVVLRPRLVLRPTQFLRPVAFLVASKAVRVVRVRRVSNTGSVTAIPSLTLPSFSTRATATSVSAVGNTMLTGRGVSAPETVGRAPARRRTK